MKRSVITGMGYYLPERIVTNADLEKMMNTSDEWIVQRSGIRERRYAAENEATADLGFYAAMRALEDAERKPEEIDRIIFATLSPDYYFPGSGGLVQERLGIEPMAALDVRNQCSGFLYGLDVADAFIRSGKARCVLLVGAEVHSRSLDYSDDGRHVAVLFGDGAGAVVIEGSDDGAGIKDAMLFAQGEYARELMVECPGTRSGLISPRMFEEKRIYPTMNGRFVFKHAVTRMVETTRRILEKNGLSTEDIDLYVFHQANLRINQMVSRELGLSEEKVFNNIERVGNTSAASIPIALCQARESGRLKRGDTVLLCGFGSGFTWGAILLEY
ncbi:MAG: ketoacyl-ACP synthase III [Candidatus Hydrogenedentota bacterium]|nr:MAG: ketoacyl-ACP synthase III [Candidatus Hydrogenedentota bacterium]